MAHGNISATHPNCDFLVSGLQPSLTNLLRLKRNYSATRSGAIEVPCTPKRDRWLTDECKSTGKSAIGRNLAKRLHRRFVDLDDRIQIELPTGLTTDRVAARVDELLALVGLDPVEYRRRYPARLSGGQRQRVGVARALAADPPVMLMDEPFGAIDPITRASLQDEFLRILRELDKTIVFVTHDIDEAIRMGTRIAIMRAGKLVQYDTPQAILARPVDPFVEAFVGGDRALKRLSLLSVDAFRANAPPPANAPRIARTANLRDALSLMLSAETDCAAVVAADGTVAGSLTLATIREALGVRA